MKDREDAVLDELTLTLEADATPGRVAAVAAMFAAIVDALPSAGVVTMVVKNRFLRASLRARDQLSASNVELVALVAENPMRSVQEAPHLRPVAAAFAKYSPDLSEFAGRFTRRRRKIAKLDSTFVESMEAATRVPDRKIAFMGSIDVYTPILRVGRDREGQPVKARILHNGQPKDVEVSVEGDQLLAFFDAAKDQKNLYRVRLDATWLRDADGRTALSFDGARLSRLTSWSAVHGTEVLSALSRTLSAEDLREIRSLREDA